jgi:hypothetical protein
MFAIVATKPLNDGTNGFRFNFLGVKGLSRKRKVVSRGFKVRKGECMIAYDMGKRTIYIEIDKNTITSRVLRHFAG